MKLTVHIALLKCILLMLNDLLEVHLLVLKYCVSKCGLIIITYQPLNLRSNSIQNNKSNNVIRRIFFKHFPPKHCLNVVIMHCNSR